jgi:hypothetical protein
LNNIEQTHIPFAALDAAYVIAMKVRQLRKALLRQPAFTPNFADASAE